MSDARPDLARLLRTWRERVDPAEAGLPAGVRRRTPGLRREELAQLTGVSMDYLVRLEQGRAANPSGQVLAALARALRLTAAERDHLYRVAGQVPPSSGQISAHLTPGMQRLIDRLADVPLGVFDPAWTLVAWNAMWAALMGDPSGWTGRERNLAWRFFTGDGYGRVVRDERETSDMAAEMVADLRAAAGRYPRDNGLRELIRDLRRYGRGFAALWDRGQVAVHAADRKTVEHPQVGRLTLDCDVLTAHGSDLRLVAYTAAPGSEAAQKLDLVRVLGPRPDLPAGRRPDPPPAHHQP